MRTIGSAVLAAAVLVTVSCGGGGSPSSPSGGGTGSSVTISITGLGSTQAFNPNPAVIDASNQTVVFRNNDRETHHIILDDGSKQTADIAPGASSAPIAVGGAKSYHCTLHPGMVGGFNGEDGVPPSNCTGAYCSTVGGGGGN